MSARLRILPAAWDDLFEIGRYIARDNPARARSFLEEMIDFITHQIASRPDSFPSRKEPKRGLRMAVHQRYLVFFTHKAGEVEIVRVLHGARHLGRIFKS